MFTGTNRPFLNSTSIGAPSSPRLFFLPSKVRKFLLISVPCSVFGVLKYHRERNALFQSVEPEEPVPVFMPVRLG